MRIMVVVGMDSPLLFFPPNRTHCWRSRKTKALFCGLFCCFVVFPQWGAGRFQSYQVAKAGLELLPYLFTTPPKYWDSKCLPVWLASGWYRTTNDWGWPCVLLVPALPEWSSGCVWLFLSSWWIFQPSPNSQPSLLFPLTWDSWSQGFLPLLAVLDPALEVFLALFLLVALCSSPGGLQVPVCAAQMQKPASCHCMCNTCRLTASQVQKSVPFTKQ